MASAKIKGRKVSEMKNTDLQAALKDKRNSGKARIELSKRGIQ